MTSMSKFSCGNSLLKTTHTILGFTLLLFIASAQLDARRIWSYPKRSVCEKVAYQVFTSCLIDIASEYTLARAKALNIEDAEERGEAYQEAFAEYREAREEARDQLVARLELCEDLGEERYSPDLDPDNFMSPDDWIGDPAKQNPYFLLEPGRVMTYRGESEEDGEVIEEIIEVTVTDTVVEILGIECIEVRDIVTVDGEIIEDTRDWYAQDLDCNVWYMGEIALNYEDGIIVDIDGSWTAGVDGALPGVLIYKVPVVDRTHRQEVLLKEAEDVAQLEAMGVEVTIGLGTYADCLQTLEYTPIEPDTFEYKFSAPGVGVIKEEKVDSDEVVELISIVEP